jgi:dTDP-4-amino-4,6-dideoxygalactose transaminase
MIHVGDFRIQEDELKAIQEVLLSGRISEGKITRQFEKQFADYIGTRYCVATSSGTAALLVGLLSLIYDERFPKFKPDAKVITTPLTYVATTNAVVLSNLTPVFVDVTRDDYALDISRIEALLSEGDPDEYAAILPVHLMGYPNRIDALKGIADRYDLVLLEDAAQAHGSLFKGQKCGSFGLFSAFSFYIAHNIQAGEMGAICTNDKTIYKLVKQLKSNGRYCSCDVCNRFKGQCPHADLRFEGDDDYDYDPRFTHQYIGYNFKTMEFQSALAITQLRKADIIKAKRHENVRMLNAVLEPVSDAVQLPFLSEDVSYLAYPLILKADSGLTRKAFRQQLDAAGIESRPFFGCIPTQQPAYAHLHEAYGNSVPTADDLGRNGLYVGCHQYLSPNDMQLIGASILQIIERTRR